ncbi:MAG TPA: FAD-dependent monooxygenase [Streptosporangiaceae bacterium]|nr:FAD-dependent monooxygenase [Streptosporangiaceae bacterium]
MSLRIAIVGAGIGGLATAGFLHRAGLAATVYEQATALTEVGAGIVVSPNAVRLIRRLGRLGRFRELAIPLEIGWEFRRWEDGRVLFSQRLGAECERRYGERCYVAHRADLLDVVRDAVPASALRLGARCVAVRRRTGARSGSGGSDGSDGSGRSDGSGGTGRSDGSGGTGEVELIFADGTTAAADVVIGADGVHSTVRAAVAAPEPPRFSGMCAFRCLIPAERAPAFALRPVQTLWVGPDHHIVHYPISAGQQVNVVAFAPARDWRVESWTAEGSVDDLRAEFAGWDGRLTELLRAAARTGRWALLDRDPLPRWTNGPIALLGDAAHPMYPFFAQGGAQALEDAVVIAGCLAASPADPVAALTRYERIRRPRATRLQLLSRGRERSNHLPDGPEQRARDAAFAGEDPLAHNAWIYGHDAERAVSAGPPRSQAGPQ